MKKSICVCTLAIATLTSVTLIYKTHSDVINIEEQKIGLADSVMASNLKERVELTSGETVMLSKDDMKEAIGKDIYYGNGYIAWKDWKKIKNNNYLNALLDVSLIHDQVYTSMKLPSENSNYFMSYRVNPYIIETTLSDYTKACGIGAFYPVYGEKLPESFNLCVGKFMVFVLKNTPDAQWEVFTEDTIIRDVKSTQLRPLPWTLKLDLATTRPVDKAFFYNDHIEFRLKDTDLMQTELYPDGSVVHFYTKKLPINSEEILATVVIYDMWSDTEEIDGKVVATIGMDYWGEDSTQLFSGHNYLVTNEHRTVIGHNISDELYKKLVNTGRSPEICLEMYHNALITNPSKE